MKKNIIIILVVVIILSIGAIVLSNITKNNKTLSEYDYVLEKETEFSEDPYTGKLPIINLNSSEVQKINNIIMNKYYRCAYGSDVFYYDYYVYKDILSLFIRITHVDGTEYGDIEYLVYNINVKTEKELSNSEVLKYLNISENEVDNIITKRLNDYYDIDTMKGYLSFNDYILSIKYSKDNNKLVILDNNLYVYTTFKLTSSLVNDYAGNINEIEIKKGLN